MREGFGGGGVREGGVEWGVMEGGGEGMGLVVEEVEVRLDLGDRGG